MTLISTFLLALMIVTLAGGTIQNYFDYGWTWQVTTIIEDENETRTDTLAAPLLLLAFLCLVAAINVANYQTLHRQETEQAETQITP